MTGLPVGWIEVDLASVVDVLDGKRIPINSDERESRIAGKAPSDLFPYYGATGQVGLIDDFIFDEPLLLLGEDGVPFLDQKKHKAYRVEGKTWVNNHAHVLRPRADIVDATYLLSYLNVFDYRGFVTGTTRLKLTQAAMNRIPVRLAPRSEQGRMAAVLDRLCRRISCLLERLDRMPRILECFRDAVLEAAVSGKLTEEWRGDRNRDLSEWGRTTFNDNSEYITVGHVGKMSSQYVATGVPFLRSLNVRPFRFDPQELKYISRQFHESLSKSSLRPGDIVVVRSGAPGQCCVIPESLPEANCSDLVILRPLKSLDPHFACIFINSRESQAYVKSKQVGVAQAHFNVGSMKVTPLLLPPLDEQHEIVRRVTELRAFADQIEEKFETTVARVINLTPSFLHKAFRGELVPQDPTDEPASVLLEGIRKGREGESTGRRQAKRSGSNAIKAVSSKPDGEKRVRRAKVAARAGGDSGRRKRSQV